MRRPMRNVASINSNDTSSTELKGSRNFAASFGRYNFYFRHPRILHQYVTSSRESLLVRSTIAFWRIIYIRLLMSLSFLNLFTMLKSEMWKQCISLCSILLRKPLHYEMLLRDSHFHTWNDILHHIVLSKKVRSLRVKLYCLFNRVALLANITVGVRKPLPTSVPYKKAQVM